MGWTSFHSAAAGGVKGYRMLKLIIIFLLLISIIGCSDKTSQLSITEADSQAHAAYIEKLFGYEVYDRDEEALVALINLNKKLHTSENLLPLIQETQDIITLKYKQTLTSSAVFDGYSIFCDKFEFPVTGEQLLKELHSSINVGFTSEMAKDIEFHYRKTLGIVISDIMEGKTEPNCDLMLAMNKQLNDLGALNKLKP